MLILNQFQTSTLKLFVKMQWNFKNYAFWRWRLPNEPILLKMPSYSGHKRNFASLKSEHPSTCYISQNLFRGVKLSRHSAFWYIQIGKLIFRIFDFIKKSILRMIRKVWWRFWNFFVNLVEVWRFQISRRFLCFKCLIEHQKCFDACSKKLLFADSRDN